MKKEEKYVKIHDELVLGLEGKIVNKGYKRIELFMEYCRNGFCGEVDLLGMADGFWDFYEVKTSFHSMSFRKAEEQYFRFKKAYHRKKINGYIYTGNRGIVRL